MPANQHLSCKVEGDELVIRIGIDTMAEAAQHENREPFWPIDQVTGFPFQKYKIINNLEWAKDLVREMSREWEDGSSPLTDLLDKASEDALEQGSLAVWSSELGISEEEAREQFL